MFVSSECAAQIEQTLRVKSKMKKGNDEFTDKSVGFFKGLFSKKKNPNKTNVPEESIKLPAVVNTKDINNKSPKHRSELDKRDDLVNVKTDTTNVCLIEKAHDNIETDKGVPENTGSNTGDNENVYTEGAKTAQDKETKDRSGHRKKKKKRKHRREDRESPKSTDRSSRQVSTYSHWNYICMKLYIGLLYCF